jgi:hypothetical protein
MENPTKTTGASGTTCSHFLPNGDFLSNHYRKPQYILVCMAYKPSTRSTSSCRNLDPWLQPQPPAAPAGTRQQPEQRGCLTGLCTNTPRNIYSGMMSDSTKGPAWRPDHLAAMHKPGDGFSLTGRNSLVPLFGLLRSGCQWIGTQTNSVWVGFI